MGATSGARASVLAVASVLGGVVLVTALVTWAASIGTSGVLRGDGPAAVRATTVETSEPTPVDGIDALQRQRERLEQQAGRDLSWVDALAVVMMVLAALVLLYLLWRSLRTLWQNWDARRRPPPAEESLDFDVLGEPEVLAEAIQRDAAEQRRLLLGGSPRNGIVGCWHRFEVQAAEVGLARQEWETSSEFTLRMLDLVGADAHEVALLAALYREARFSEHPVDEDARARALAALDAVHAGLVAVGGRR